MDSRKQTLRVIINSPNKLIWEGRAESVSSENSAGAFDILPQHANFITIIENKPIHIRSREREQKFQYENAVLSVREGFVTIYADI